MIAKKDYSKIDALIVDSIKNGSDRFLFINTGDVRRESESLSTAKPEEAFRVVDRRLQALRGDGKIKHCNGKWIIRASA